MKRSIILVTVCMMLVGAASIVPAGAVTLPFLDSFSFPEGSDPSDWEEILGNWEVQNGQYTAWDSISGWQFTLVNDLNIGNFVVKYDQKGLYDSLNSGAFIFRWQGPNPDGWMLLFRMFKSGAGFLERTLTGWPARMWKGWSKPVDVNDTAYVKITAQGNTFQASAVTDGGATLAMTWTAPSSVWPTGRAGLASERHDGLLTFDNVVIHDVNDSRPGSVTGTVTSADDGLPVNGAVVEVPGTTVKTTTDANGSYTLADLPITTEYLRVNALGFDVKMVHINLAPDASITVDIALTGSAITLPSPDSFLHMQQVLSQYPKRARSGVDLLWHTDRAIEYSVNMLDRKNFGMPYMYERVYHGPVKIRHDTHWGWDAPHAVARILLSTMSWEELARSNHVDKKAVDQLRWLIHQTISDSDNRVHYYNPATGRGSIDGHSHRETLLALVRLARVRKDEESLELARRLVQGVAAAAQNPGHSPDPTWSGRMIRALLEYHRFTGDPLGLEVAKQFADEMYTGLFDDTGKFPSGHNHSILGTLTGLIDYGLYTNQAKYVNRMKKVLDIGIWNVRSRFGMVFSGAGPGAEGNASADVVQAEILLGLNGYPEYFDDVERILRNHHLGSQHLDPTITVGPTAEQLGLVDNDIEVYTNAPKRVLGGFPFTQANELFDIINDTGDPNSNGEFDMPTDTPSAMIDGNIDAWNAIVTSSEAGLRVNLLFSKETRNIDIRSFIPIQGRVEMDIKRPTAVYVRIPGYVDLKDLTVTVNGADLPKRMFGPYLLIPKQPDDYAQVVLQFPQPWKVTTETISGVTYKVEWVGDTVWNIKPAGSNVPIYTPARLAVYGVTVDNMPFPH